jgi:hypothetical protein
MTVVVQSNSVFCCLLAILTCLFAYDRTTGWLATKMGWGGVHLKDEHGRTALSRAAANGHANCVRYLLESGANPNAASAKGVTPLMTAAARNFFVSMHSFVANNQLFTRQRSP